MNGFAKLLRRTALLLIVVGIWIFVYYAANPYYERSIFERVVILALALILIIGLLPKMYLQILLDKISEKSYRSPRWGIVILSVGAPILFLALHTLFAHDAIEFLQADIPMYLREPDKWTLVLNSIGGGIQIIFLIANLTTLFSISDHQE